MISVQSLCPVGSYCVGAGEPPQRAVVPARAIVVEPKAALLTPARVPQAASGWQ
jgi:hypothetical protein